MVNEIKMAIKTTCSNCDNQLQTLSKRYCNPCHAEWMRANRPTYSELNPEQKKKDCARSYLGVYIRRGKVTKQPCENCHNPKSEAHHEDYNKPLDVKWYCRPCHLEIHKSEKTKF